MDFFLKLYKCWVIFNPLIVSEIVALDFPKFSLCWRNYISVSFCRLEPNKGSRLSHIWLRWELEFEHLQQWLESRLWRDQFLNFSTVIPRVWAEAGSGPGEDKSCFTSLLHCTHPAVSLQIKRDKKSFENKPHIRKAIFNLTIIDITRWNNFVWELWEVSTIKLNCDCLWSWYN